MKTFKDLLIELDACKEAKEWAGNMTIEEVVDKCYRGDWLLWLAKEIDVDDRKLTLAKGLCANTVRHLMKDERSVKAVDAAISYGKGEMGLEELNAAAADASAAVFYTSYAATAAYASAAHAAAYAAAAHAADAADDAAYAYADAAAYAAADAAYAAADAADADTTAYAAINESLEQILLSYCCLQSILKVFVNKNS